MKRPIGETNWNLGRLVALLPGSRHEALEIFTSVAVLRPKELPQRMKFVTVPESSSSSSYPQDQRRSGHFLVMQMARVTKARAPVAGDVEAGVDA
jgi:hypothetical protein